MLQVKNSSGKVPRAKQNQFDANDMWLPLGEFFFFFFLLRGQRFIPGAPNRNPFFI
jgi:hypothetical protein